MSKGNPVLDNIQRGYYYYIGNNPYETCEIWFVAWENYINIVDQNGIKSVEESADFLGARNVILLWLEDFEEIMRKNAEKSPEFFEKINKVCKQYLKRFDNATDKGSIMKMRKTFIESLFALGEVEKAEEYMVKLLKKFPDWTQGWIVWADSLVKYGDWSKTEYNRAISILDTALENKQRDGKLPIFEKMMEIYGLSKNKEGISRVKEMMKDSWGME